MLLWARRNDALVIEDDYDAEYRYDRAPLGAIQGLDRQRVAYAGTASKTLAPGLRLGWLVVPDALHEPLLEAKLLADRGSPTLDQLALADFIVRGEFERHLRRMRSAYREQRAALLDGIHTHLPQLRPAGIAAGLHLICWLPDDLGEAAVVEAAAEHGVSIGGISRYRLTPGPPGLIFGYATLTPRAAAAGTERLAAAIAQLHA